ncbi:helix-turn-helix domain-containing protein [Streptomyces sp. JJ66]|uniref:helix-turn-helix domain-containing protein n=1 Tax=Streptomyces sp. JJ66 TaxID=2803843 RepID=UPI001C5918D4|nr:helix-turn-helix transcriptional regulator [Streptomyces sp. JJ66]MBW1602717.1 helix-turn-helix domain-containing protein [Streptomyces sp. JJ66]
MMLKQEPLDGAAYLGREVFYARMHAGVTQRELAIATHYKAPYISKVENGTLLASEQFVAACDRFFNTSGYFTRLRQQIVERSHPSWFVPYVKLEQSAASICNYSNSMIMGMLQTEAYATAVYRSAHPRESAAEISDRVAARVRRREVMRRENPPLLWAILHEACLRIKVGGPGVMAEQMSYLLEQAEAPHVTVQVLPFSAGAPAAHSQFIVLTQQDGLPVVYTETSIRGHVDESASAVEEAQATYDCLRAAARSPEDSLAMIREAMEAYSHEAHS